MRRFAQLAIVVSALMATPLAAGPSWMSIEYPANPYDQRTREAFLVVNTYHHGEPANTPVRGSAEGIVRGERRSLPLTFRETSRPGAYALTQQWPREGKWVLMLTLHGTHGLEASGLVVLGADGTPSRVTVPTRRDGPHQVPRPVTADEVAAALAAAGEQRATSR